MSAAPVCANAIIAETIRSIWRGRWRVCLALLWVPLIFLVVGGSSSFSSSLIILFSVLRRSSLFSSVLENSDDNSSLTSDSIFNKLALVLRICFREKNVKTGSDISERIVQNENKLSNK